MDEQFLCELEDEEERLHLHQPSMRLSWRLYKQLHPNLTNEHDHFNIKYNNSPALAQANEMLEKGEEHDLNPDLIYWLKTKNYVPLGLLPFPRNELYVKYRENVSTLSQLEQHSPQNTTKRAF